MFCKSLYTKASAKYLNLSTRSLHTVKQDKVCAGLKIQHCGFQMVCQGLMSLVLCLEHESASELDARHNSQVDPGGSVIVSVKSAKFR